MQIPTGLQSLSESRSGSLSSVLPKNLVIGYIFITLQEIPMFLPRPNWANWPHRGHWVQFYQRTGQQTVQGVSQAGFLCGCSIKCPSSCSCGSWQDSIPCSCPQSQQRDRDMQGGCHVLLGLHKCNRMQPIITAPCHCLEGSVGPVRTERWGITERWNTRKQRPGCHLKVCPSQIFVEQFTLRQARYR